MAQQRRVLSTDPTAGVAVAPPSTPARRVLSTDPFAGQAPQQTQPRVLSTDPAQGSFLGRVRDVGISALKGAITVPETVVGLLDIPTGGRVGKALEDTVGFKPAEAKAILDTYYSEQQQKANRAVAEADGLLETTAAALKNPSTILHAVVESAPMMLEGGVIGRMLIARGLKAGGGAVAAATGEGTVAAGAAAESMRAQNPDRTLTPKQAALATASGVGTGTLGLFGAKLARQLGIEDFDTMLAAGIKDQAAGKNIVKAVIYGAVQEGFFEELPQSVQEQVLQNIATEKPWDEGVNQAAVLGAFAGGVMGGGAQAVAAVVPRRQQTPAPAPAPESRPTPAPAASTQTPSLVEQLRQKRAQGAPVRVMPIPDAPGPVQAPAAATPAPAPVSSPTDVAGTAPAAPPPGGSTTQTLSPIQELEQIEEIAKTRQLTEEEARRYTDLLKVIDDKKREAESDPRLKLEPPSRQEQPDGQEETPAPPPVLTQDERNARARAEAAAEPPASTQPEWVKAGQEVERRVTRGVSPTGVERRRAAQEGASVPEEPRALVAASERSEVAQDAPETPTSSDAPRARFLEVYTRTLTEAIQKSPAEYAYPASDAPKVAEKMATALEAGTANVNSKALKAAAKVLGIWPTMAGWKAYFADPNAISSGAPADAYQRDDEVTYEGQSYRVLNKVGDNLRISRPGEILIVDARKLTRVTDDAQSPRVLSTDPAAGQLVDVVEQAEADIEDQGIGEQPRPPADESEELAAYRYLVDESHETSTGRRRYLDPDEKFNISDALHEAVTAYPEYVERIPERELNEHLDDLDELLEADKSEWDWWKDDNEDTLRDLQRRLRREAQRRDGQQGLPLDPVEAAVQSLRTAIESQVREQLGAPVETVQEQAQNGRDDRTSPRLGDDAGQLPERRPGAAVTARTGDGDVLAPVPTGADEGPGSEGTERPSDRDSGDVVAGGIRPADGDQPGDARTGRHRTEPGRALAPTGATSEPGSHAHDYTLTPERIAAIIERGTVTRARDNIAAIRLARTLREEQRQATHEEQELLAKYVGWGASDMADFLRDQKRHTWSATESGIWQELRDLLSDEERQALAHSAQNAHFTYDLYPPIWKALETAGFTGGRVLEPAVGVGHAFGFMPPAIRNNSTLSATELEPLTATIAQALYPSARVQLSGYEQARIARDTQDLVISNVPFGKYGVRDPKLPKMLTERIHNYFFAKALEHVRPGGLVVFVTSRYTLDGPEWTGVRRYLSERAHFLGAIRLPNTAFDKSAKTEVVTDLIVLQRLQEGETPRNAQAFINAREVEEFRATRSSGYGNRKKTTTSRVYRSTWYDEHPELVLGTQTTEGTMYGPGQYTVEGTDEDLSAAIERALGTILPEGAYTAATTTATTDTPKPVEGYFKAGELRVDGDRIVSISQEGEPTDATPTMKRGGVTSTWTGGVDRLKGMIGIRDALRATVATMKRPDATEKEIQASQKALTKVYEAFSKEFGALNDPTNKRLFARDPEAANLLGLEKLKISASTEVNKQGATTLRVKQEVVGRADIFTKRVIHAQREIAHADTPYDALLASISSRFAIDWNYMARITGDGQVLPSRVRALQDALKAQGRIFEEPNGAWVLADEYLSGDVVSKLEDAEAAAEREPDRFKANIDALKAIRPKPKTREDLIEGTVGMALGSHWIPPEDIAAFVNDELGIEGNHYIALDVSSQLVQWTARFAPGAEAAGNRHSLAVPSTGGIYGFTEMLEDALNLTNPDLGRWVRDGKNRYWERDVQATDAARANIEELRAKWMEWLFAHPDVQDRLLASFNERYNRVVPRTFDGSHLLNYHSKDANGLGVDRTAALPGLSLPYQLYPHQLRAIWRALISGNTLLAHEVGAGKTFEMIVIAMEMRRTGRARKPLITVPTNLLGQWREDILKAYPNARVLAFDASDLDAKKRQQAMARIAFGDWDIVLVPHSSFGLLKVSDERMAAVMQKWVDELMDLEQAAGGARGNDDKSVKKIAALRARLQDRIQTKLDAAQGTDNNLTWEDLGVDALLVDEAHVFKNLFFASKLEGIRGLSRSESDRALDMFIKIQDINEQSHYRNLIFATATPVMNSMAEIFTMQRYLQPQALEAVGVDSFDNWYAMFAEAVLRAEQRPDGSYEEVNRIRRFRNLELLYRTFSSVMDYVGWEDMPYLKLPKLKDGRVRVIETETHPIYGRLQQWFADRLDNIKRNPPRYNRRTKVYTAPDRPHALTGAPTGRLDNILTIMNDARLAAIDPRLVLGDEVTDFPGSRMQAAVAEMVKTYKAERVKKGVQLVFLDVGTPREGQAGPLEFLGKNVEVEDTTGGSATGVEDADVVDDESDVPSEEAGEFNLYFALRSELVKRGVPSKEIAFIHQARNAAERLALFQAAREGRIRFLFASTDRGSVGMNIQERLVREHHFDVPRAMRPGDIRQRDGRIIRQGNTYEEIDITRYVTKGTTDEWLYGLLAGKQDIVTKFMRGDVKGEYVEEDPSSMSIEEAQVRATGDPRGVELTELRAAARRMGAQAAAQERAQGQAQADKARLTPAVPAMRADLEELRAWLKGSYPSLKGDDFAVVLHGTTYTKPGKANERLVEIVRELAEKTTPRGRLDPTQIGTFGSLGIFVSKPHTWAEELAIRLVGGPIDASVTSIDYPQKDKPGERFADGRNLVASLQDRYGKLPLEEGYAEMQLRDAETRLADAEKVLARPTDLVERYRTAQARIAALEKELKEESAARAAAREAEHKARQAAAAAAAKPADQVESKLDSTEDDGGDSAASVGQYTETETTGTARIRSAAAPVAEARPIEFPELVDLARELGKVPGVVQRFRKAEATGRFADGAITLPANLFKAGNEIQLAGALAHELGHLIDWLPHQSLKRGNLLGRLFSLRKFLKATFTGPNGQVKNAKLKAELVALSAKWRPWDRETATPRFIAYRDSARELYADAISVLLNNPALLEREAPTFFREVFDAMDRKPDVRDAYFDLQELLSGTKEELVERRRQGVRRMYEAGDTAALDLERRRQQEKELARKDFWLRLKIQLVDRNYAVIDRVRALAKQGVQIASDLNPIYFLEERNYLGGKLKGFVEQHIAPVYRSLQDADIHWNAFGEALLYARIIAGDRSEVANPRGLSPKVAQDMLDSLKRELGPEKAATLDAAMADFRAAVKEVAEQAYQAGLYTDDLHAQMAKNPAYVTFQVIEHLEKGVTSRVYRQIGTLKDIVHPADATTLKMLVTLRAIEHNRVKQSVVSFLQRHFPDDIKPAKTVWSGRGQRPIESRDPKERLITYFEHGKPVGRYVDPYIAAAVENESIGQNLAVIAILRRMNSGLFRPLFTTFNLGFQLFNVQRDFWRFWKNLPKMTLARAVRRYWEAVPLAKVRAFGLSKKPTAQELQAWQELIDAERAGIFSVTFNDLIAGREVEDTQIEDIFARHDVAGVYTPKRAKALKPLLAMLDVIKETGDFIETLPKAAALVEFKGRGPIRGLSAEQRSFIRRKVGSPDFLAGGSLKPISNEVFLFSNAITQAWRSDIEVATDPKTRAGFWWKTTAVNLVPKFLLMAAMLGLAGDALRRMVERMTEYDRTNYIPLPIGEDGANVVYLRIPQDDTGRVVGGLFWKLLRLAQGDAEVGETAAQVLDYSAGQFPSIAPGITAVQATAQMVGGQNPRDAFRGRDVLTEDEQRARGWVAWRKFLGWEFQQLGGGIVWKFYPGEERPTRDTLTQRILEIPVLSNVVGRFVRSTNYGDTEALRAAQRRVQGVEAGRRLEERDAVKGAVRAFQRLPDAQRTPARVMAMAAELTAGLYEGDPATARLRLPRIEERLRTAIVRGEADPLMDAVMSAQSREQQVAIIEEWLRRRPPVRQAVGQ